MDLKELLRKETEWTNARLSVGWQIAIGSAVAAVLIGGFVLYVLRDQGIL